MLRSSIISFVFIIIVLGGCNRFEDKEPVTSKPMYDLQNDKLWAHRVNTAKEANELLQEFNGIELDVVFEKKSDVFDVRHDVDGTVSGISLDAYFDSIVNVTEHYYWIDFKNLKVLNVYNSLKRMKYILSKYNINNNVIVESSNAGLLNKFYKASIYTSYWVPHFSGSNEPADTVEIINRIKSNLGKYNCNALSAHYPMYAFLDKYFNNCNIHVWTNELKTVSDKNIIYELHNNSNIKVILVDYKYNFIVEMKYRGFGHN
ncbi:MAG: hypothetical protein ABII90_06105 [Bacteroidota bacterium]